MAWPGLIELLWLIAVMVGPLLKDRGDHDSLNAGRGAAVICFLVSGVGANIFIVPQTANTLWAFSGMLFALRWRPQTSPSEE